MGRSDYDAGLLSGRQCEVSKRGAYRPSCNWQTRSGADTVGGAELSPAEHEDAGTGRQADVALPRPAGDRKAGTSAQHD